MKKYLLKKNGGFALVQVLVFASIGVLLVGGLTNWAGANIKAARQAVSSERAFQVAEAGIEYYRWHLAHAKTDFKDGHASSSASYIHDYFDKDGNKVGTFELFITPPLVGSTVVKIVSTGRVVENANVKRSIEAILAVPSLAKYAIVANDTMRFGEGTEVFGPLHSNGGIRFDGLAHNIVTSAKDHYNDPDHNGNDEFGVHTHMNINGSGSSESFRSDEAPGHVVNPRPDVFMSGRQFPVPAVDWAGFTSDLSQMKTDAISGGKKLASSGSQGYNIVLKTNDTFDLYKVTSVKAAPNHCNKDNKVDGQDGWASWTIKNQTLLGNYPLPANGLIFAEDNVWVEGQINTARVTIAAGTFPESASTYKSITINKDIKYTNHDGRDVIALVAQNNINVGLESEDNLEIDAALVAKNGRVGRYYYGSNCDDYADRDTITLFGMLASNDRYGFAYSNGGTVTSGYETRIINYDGNLLYGPPPSFPLTSDQYQTISWREIRN